MDMAASFKELMKQRHSVRFFQKKEIQENTLKDIISTALNSPSWGNSQPWNIYVASGKTLEEIRKVWISKNKEGIKGYSDLEPIHRQNFSERSQKILANLLKEFTEVGKDPDMKKFAESQAVLFNAPTLVYLTIPKGQIKYSIFDLGALEMSILLAAKSQGVDSLAAYEAIKYPDVIRKFCKIPETEDIIIGIGLGYEDNNELNNYRSKKLSLEEACHFYN